MNDPPLILIVDDEPNVLTVLRLAFRDRVWQVDAIDDAEVADVVIVDENMPDMDGIVPIKQVRSGGSRTGPILVTGYGSSQSAIRIWLEVTDVSTLPLESKQFAVIARQLVQGLRKTEPIEEADKDGSSL